MKFKPVYHFESERHSGTLDETGFKACEPGRWDYHWRSDDTLTAAVYCQDCRVKAILDDHTISQDGTVHPSLGCPLCGWHVWIRLKDWYPDVET